MERVVFFNHLRQGSASNERQEGLGKCLRKEGYRTEFVMRRRRTRAEAGVLHQVSPKPTTAETRVFWDEPLELKVLGNLSLTSRATRGADIIHVNRASPYTSTLLRLGKWGSRGALVVDMEDWDGYGGYSSYMAEYGPKGWLLNFFERTFPKTADAIIVVSELLRSQILKLGVPPDKVFKIPNGFDPDLFHLGIDPSPMRETYGLTDYPVLMYASAYWQFERAQHSFALSVFRRVCDVYPEARLLMVGAGNLNIRELVHEFRLDANVIITGFVPRYWMPGLMAAADAVFHVISDHPFHRASSPMVVTEYMAMGKAIVAPRIGELATMLSSGAGALVERWDSNLMADQLVRVLRDESLRSELGRRAAIVAKEAYSYEVGTAALREAYRVAVEDRSSKRASD